MRGTQFSAERLYLRSGSATVSIVFVRGSRLVVSHAVTAGKDTMKYYRVVSCTLDFEPNTFVVFIQIRTSRYLECNIILEVKCSDIHAHRNVL